MRSGVKMGLMKKLLAIIVLGLLLNTNAQAKHKTFDDPFLHWNTFEAKGSENHYKFQSSLREDKDVLKEIKNTKKTGLISYLLFEDDKIVIDESDIPDKTRQGDQIINGLLQSHSMGKSLVSYVTGHAICEGYISSVDEKLTGWDIIENTLYDNQVLIDLLNMQAGDQRLIGERIKPRRDGILKNKKDKYGKKINVNTTPLKTLMKDYFQNTKKSRRVYNYSALTTNVIMNYVIFKTGDDWEKLLHKVFNEHVKVKDSVYFHQTAPLPLWGPYSGRYSFYATRYDYLRIAKTIMDDWNNNTCAGKYLKTIYERRISKDIQGYKVAGISGYAKKYGGQFHFDFDGLKKRKILGMSGMGGQNIMIDFERKRILLDHYINGYIKIEFLLFFIVSSFLVYLANKKKY